MVEGAKLKFVSLTSVRGLFVSNHYSKGFVMSINVTYLCSMVCAKSLIRHWYTSWGRGAFYSKLFIFSVIRFKTWVTSEEFL